MQHLCLTIQWHIQSVLIPLSLINCTVLYYGLCNCFCFFLESSPDPKKFTRPDLFHHSVTAQLSSLRRLPDQQNQPPSYSLKQFHVLDNISWHLELSCFFISLCFIFCFTFFKLFQVRTKFCIFINF
jgi:hypothetical protein